MKFLLCQIPGLPANGMAVFPFILVKLKQHKKNDQLINHEKIHLAQQIELLIFPFYFLYLFNYLINLFLFRNHHKAYMNIIFEKEAYAGEADLTYLSKRRHYQWLRFI